MASQIKVRLDGVWLHGPESLLRAAGRARCFAFAFDAVGGGEEDSFVGVAESVSRVVRVRDLEGDSVGGGKFEG